MSEDTDSARTDEKVSREGVEIDLLEFRDAARSHLPHREALIPGEDTVRAGSNVSSVGGDKTHHQKIPKVHKVLDMDDGHIHEGGIHKNPPSDHGNVEEQVVHASL